MTSHLLPARKSVEICLYTVVESRKISGIKVTNNVLKRTFKKYYTIELEKDWTIIRIDPIRRDIELEVDNQILKVNAQYLYVVPHSENAKLYMALL
jgi:hypothetical protein